MTNVTVVRSKHKLKLELKPNVNLTIKLLSFKILQKVRGIDILKICSVEV
jgi:hypothetical protein